MERASGPKPPGFTGEVPAPPLPPQVPGTPADTVERPELPDPNIEFTGTPAEIEAELEKDPGYRFRKEQGMKAMRANLNAQGIALTGDAAKALQQWGQQFASQEFDRARQRRHEQYRRTMDSVLTNYGVSKEAFARSMLVHQQRRADILSNYGMTMQQWQAMMDTVRLRFGMNQDAFNRWARIFAIEETAKLGVLSSIYQG